MKQFAILALVLVLLLTAACTAAQPETPTEAPTEPVVTEAPTQAPTEPEPTAPPETTDPNAWTINFLTGEANITEQQARPVAVMIPNDSLVRGYQYGIETADMLMECETEGGITRLLAVWADDTHLPDFIGPVRSARTPFAKMAISLDAFYAHCGGSVVGLQTVTNSGMDHIDARFYDGGRNNTSATFWRDSSLISAMNLEHSLVTGGNNLRNYLKKNAVRDSGKNHSPFVFGEVTGGSPALEAEINLSGAQTISFKYDAEKNVYTKYNGTLSNGRPHTAANGTQISAANVVVIYAKRYIERQDSSTTVYDFELDSGSGIVLSSGVVRDITWSRTEDGLTFTNPDGSPLTAAEGKLYLCIVDSARTDSTTVK